MRVGLSWLTAAALSAACHAPLGSSVRTTTPKPFESPQLGTYEIRPEAPAPELRRSLKIAVLPFKDERAIARPGVDRIWSKDAESPTGRRVQPREIRGMLRRGLENGLRRWESVSLVPAEELDKRLDTDVLISGRVLRCEVDATFSNYRAESELEITVRGASGLALTDAPILVKSADSKRIYDNPSDWRSVEPLPPNPLAPVVERSLEAALERFLRSPAFASALREAAGTDAAEAP